MKILSLHCDYIKFKPLKKALKSAELEAGQESEKQVKEALVILTAVESGDSLASVKELVNQVKDIAKQVNAKNIVLYPYAHLSSSLSSPDTALAVLKEAEKLLKKEKFNVTRAPFGFYKTFELKVKGHPLSELSREITVEGGKEVEEKFDYQKLLKELSKTKLDRKELKDNDHRILGQRMDLFSFSPAAPGMAFWHNNGLIVRNELINFWRDEHRKAGYQEISTPQILDNKLWKVSGHWQKYKDNMFMTKYEKRDFAVKPMNCPGGMLVYRQSTKSYNEFPLRIAELGIVHRQELSGVLAGLFRVIQFIQDDAHVFCTEKQLESELLGVMKLADILYKKFELSYNLELSTRPEKRIGDDKIWDNAEKALASVLKKSKKKFKINKGDGAFYGPKIDFHIKDSLGRTWQCGTIQLDFAMPERFDLTYIDEKNNQKRPIIIHRALYGSLERFIGIMLEHLNGNLPVWLSPIQARVVNFTDRNTKAAEKIAKQLQDAGVRVDTDFRNSTVEYKTRDAQMQKIPYFIVIGDKEEKANTLAIRPRGQKPNFGVKAKDFIKQIKEEIEKRK